MEQNTAIIPYAELEKMGGAIARSGLFGMKRPEEAIALMLVAQAEGYPAALAARDYHIIDGRPSLKADAMLARFQQAGGKVEWHDLTDLKASATFFHQQGGTVRVEWDIQRAKKAEVWREKTSTGKTGMWIKYPRQMLRARVISEGVRTVYPACVCGIYTPEEVQDMEPEQKPAPRETTATVIEPEPVAPETLMMTEEHQTAISRVCEMRITTPAIKAHYRNWMLKTYNVHLSAELPDARYGELCDAIVEKFPIPSAAPAPQQQPGTDADEPPPPIAATTAQDITNSLPF